ncbi:MAG: hypothetical protein KDD50_12510 [Bdellovibrionales bacterium]|nr:hypothetical protein [Bdellovibrionales bacterium]
MTQEDVNQLIDYHYIDDLDSKGRLSSYIEDESYQILFLRQLAPKKDDIDFTIFCFLFKNKTVYIYDNVKKTFTELAEKNSIYTFLNSMLSNNKGIIQTFSAEIESLEDDLYTRNFPTHFIDLWFDLRNELSKIDRYNSRLAEVIRDFYTSKNHIHIFNKIQYQDLISTIEFTQSKIKDELSRLDILHHYYLSIKGDKLNRSIFILTIISGLFLPLNLIVGFFGMNTENLFFKDNPYGTNLVLYILLGLLVLQLFFLPILKLLDRLIFNHLLGQTDLYKKLNKKFDKISDTFKVE